MHRQPYAPPSPRCRLSFARDYVASRLLLQVAPTRPQNAAGYTFGYICPVIVLRVFCGGIAQALAGVSGGEDWIRTNEGISQQIYSLPRLATSVPPHY